MLYLNNLVRCLSMSVVQRMLYLNNLVRCLSTERGTENVVS